MLLSNIFCDVMGIDEYGIGIFYIHTIKNNIILFIDIMIQKQIYFKTRIKFVFQIEK